jgi:hypothetical protein
MNHRPDKLMLHNTLAVCCEKGKVVPHAQDLRAWGVFFKEFLILYFLKLHLQAFLY